MSKKTASDKDDQPRPFTEEELARMTPSARKLCQMVGKNAASRQLTPEEIELLRASKQELQAFAFGLFPRAGVPDSNTNASDK